MCVDLQRDSAACAPVISRYRAVVRALTIMALLAADAPHAHAGETEMAAALDAKALRGAQAAALAVRVRDGQVLFARQPDAALAPASNQKILTALAVLTAYGPSHRFTTRIFADRAADDQGRVGRLWVRGGGDPALTSEQWWRLSADLRRSGVRWIEGDIVVDDAAFDAERWNPAWGAPSARAYYPAVGALMANYGSFTVEVRPGAHAGDAVRVDIDPPVPYFELENQAKTIGGGAGDTLAVERQTGSGGERVLISGTLSIDAAPQVIPRSVAEPALYAGAVLRMQLVANGIAVGGDVRRGEVPADAHELLAFEGHSLSETIQLLMKYSNNGIAETLCKGLGATDSGEQGSWSAGLTAMRRHLGSAGVDVSAFTLVDGSGLSPTNRVSPRGLVAALQAARASFAFAPELMSALPIAGVDGTLRQRDAAVTGKVRAKTGLLTGAVALSGYAQLRDGEEAIFSVLVNGYQTGDAEVMAAVDRFAVALVQSSSQPATRHATASGEQ